MQVIIVGGGIAGLSAALSLHQIGVDCRIYESVATARAGRPRDQPAAECGARAHRAGIGRRSSRDAGILTAELAFYNRHGQLIWTEPRGKAAGYNWPQISISRGKLQEVLLAAVHARLGPQALVTGHQLASLRTARRQGPCALHRSGRPAGGRSGRRPADRCRRHPLRRAQAFLSRRSRGVRRLSALSRDRRRRSVSDRTLDGGRRPSHPSRHHLSHRGAAGRQGDDQLARLHENTERCAAARSLGYGRRQDAGGRSLPGLELSVARRAGPHSRAPSACCSCRTWTAIRSRAGAFPASR